MKYPFRQFIILCITVSLLLPGHALFASNPADTFNPNSIISDEEMQDWQSMNRADIQAFLSDKGSYLATYRAPDVNGTTRLASDTIAQAARTHRINPKHILVTLQKEQSLITSKSPTQYQLDWAAGYGVCDSCDTNDPALQKHRGFGNQVDSAAAIIRWYYDNAPTERWIKRANQTYIIDGIEVTPTSHATAYLYTYTPHIHGNQNNWIIYNKWFDTLYPNGTLVKTLHDPTVYLIQGDIIRPFKNLTSLATRFDPKLVVTVPASELNRYKIGRPISLPNYAVLEDPDGTFYLLDFDIVRPFESEDVVRDFGYHPDEIIEVTSGDLAGYRMGKVIRRSALNPLGQVIQVRETGEYYYLAEDAYHLVADPRMIQINYPHLSPVVAPADTLQTYTRGEPATLKNGTVFGVEGSNKIYVAENGKKHHIPTERVFFDLGYKPSHIIWVNQFAGMTHADGQPLYIHTDLPDVETLAPEKKPSPVTTEEPTAVKQITRQPESSPKIIIPPRVEIDEDDEDTIPPMQRTPTADVSFVGPVFQTDIDTYLVAEYDTGNIIAGKNIDTLRPIASFTKVLAAYRLLEEGIRPEETVTYDSELHMAMYHYYRIDEGEIVKNKHLMQAQLISSLNTPAYMMIDSLDMPVQTFVDGMNRQAASWGLENTTFVDPNGLEEETVSTAREYSTLFRNSTQNKTVKEILGTRTYSYDEVLDLDEKPTHSGNHTNKLAARNDLPFYIHASKTGYLHEAGAGLVMLVERPIDGKRFVIVTMGNPNHPTRFDDPERLTTWALERF